MLFSLYSFLEVKVHFCLQIHETFFSCILLFIHLLQHKVNIWFLYDYFSSHFSFKQVFFGFLLSVNIKQVLYNVPLSWTLTFQKNVICFIESTLKTIKNAFYFILKALFILQIFNFFIVTFWSCRKNSLIRKIKLISKL